MQFTHPITHCSEFQYFPFFLLTILFYSRQFTHPTTHYSKSKYFPIFTPNHPVLPYAMHSPYHSLVRIQIFSLLYSLPSHSARSNTLTQSLIAQNLNIYTFIFTSNHLILLGATHPCSRSIIVQNRIHLLLNILLSTIHHPITLCLSYPNICPYFALSSLFPMWSLTKTAW
jgi:hypothetical protein